jgi:threonine aldolase
VLVDTTVVGLDPLEAVLRMKEQGVGCTIVPPRVRMVTHVDISDEDVETAIAAWKTATAG